MKAGLNAHIDKSLQVNSKQRTTTMLKKKLARLQATCKGTSISVVVVALFGVSGSFTQREHFLPQVGTVSLI